MSAPLTEGQRDRLFDAALNDSGDGWDGVLAEVAAMLAEARAEALREAAYDIRDRRRTFAELNADDQYLAALSDAFGLVSNRRRAALANPEDDQ